MDNDHEFNQKDLDKSKQIKEAANRLGKLIGQTTLGKQLKSAYEDFEEDEEAYDLFKDFQELQKEVEEARQKGEPVSEESVEELNEKMRELQKEKSFRKWMQAQEQFDQLMADVQKVIQVGINEGQSSKIDIVS